MDSSPQSLPITAESLIARLRARQARFGRQAQPPRPDARYGFVFSSMDRLHYSLQTLASLDCEPGFDVVWVDGSREPESRDLTRLYRWRHARLVETHRFIRGGPDRAIIFGLQRLIALGYDYCGLIENDLIFLPGWFSALKDTLSRAAADGLAVGAAQVRNYRGRVAAFANGYSIDFGVGAGMVLFPREAAVFLLEHYHRLCLTRQRIQELSHEAMGISLEDTSFWKMFRDPARQHLTADWGFAPTLYGAGWTSVGTVPSRCYDLEFNVYHVMSIDEYTTATNFVPNRLLLPPAQ